MVVADADEIVDAGGQRLLWVDEANSLELSTCLAFRDPTSSRDRNESQDYDLFLGLTPGADPCS